MLIVPINISYIFSFQNFGRTPRVRDIGTLPGVLRIRGRQMSLMAPFKWGWAGESYFQDNVFRTCDAARRRAD